MHLYLYVVVLSQPTAPARVYHLLTGYVHVHVRVCVMYTHMMSPTRWSACLIELAMLQTGRQQPISVPAAGRPAADISTCSWQTSSLYQYLQLADTSGLNRTAAAGNNFRQSIAGCAAASSSLE